MKPKPLDLKKINVFEIIHDDNEGNISLGGDLTIGWDKANNLVRNKIKQQIKSACDFYLDSKADPFLDDKPESIICVLDDFIRFYSHLKENEKDYIYSLINKAKEIEKKGLSNVSEIVADFNDWLFKLAFKSVLGDKK